MERSTTLGTKTHFNTKSTEIKTLKDNNSFYRAFEERFRGSRELIKSRLQIYMPFVDHCLELYENCTALDLGCGRGEWLELMLEKGLHIQGVDTDPEVLKAFKELNLPATQKDALLAMQELPDASLVLVTAFQVVEHIPFHVLQSWVKEAYRVLKPGGLLILETQNPENLGVGATSFYLDPSHQRPIPPLLLAFLPEYYGFERVKILRLQEDRKFAEGQTTNMVDVLLGVSPDYAVVAQKKTSKERLKLFDKEFFANYGVTLQDLCASYDKETGEKNLEQQKLITQQKTWAQELDKRQQTNEKLAQQLSSKLEEIDIACQHAHKAVNLQSISIENLKAQIQNVNETIAEQSTRFKDITTLFQSIQEATKWQSNRIEAVETQFHHLRELLEQKSAQMSQFKEQCQNLTDELQAIRASGCWKITAPYRVMVDFIRHGFKNIRSRKKPKVQASSRKYLQVIAAVFSAKKHAREQSKSFTAPTSFAGHSMLEEIVTTGIPTGLSQRSEKIYTTLAQEVLYHHEINNVDFTKLPLCKLGIDYFFCTNGSGLKFFEHGLSIPEKDFTWTLGKSSRIALSFIDKPTKDFSLLLSYAGIYKHSQRLIVKSEQGVELFNDRINCRNQIKLTIPLETLRGKNFYLTFLYPDACSPQSCGESADTRELAFALRSIRFD